MSDVKPKRSVSKPLLIGCGVVVVLLVLCGGLAAFFAKRGVDAFSAQLNESAEDELFARRWKAPPEDAAEGAFAPEPVAGFALTESDEKAAFPALGIEREGWHAVYEKGEETVEVSVYRADEAETSGVFDEVVRRIDDDDRFKSHSHVRKPRSLRFSVSDPVDLNGVLWHAGGWLVFVRSATVDDLRPFLREYLTAVEAGPGEATEDAEPEEVEAVEAAKPEAGE